MTKLNNIKCFLLDMDGTIYLNNTLISKATEFINLLDKKGKKFVFFTNNSSKNSLEYQKKLNKLGIKVKLKQIINSGQVTANYIKNKKENAVVYPVGTPSLEKELSSQGLKIEKNKNKKIDFLVLGFDKTLTYKKIWDAHDLILNGVDYIATNPDLVCPLEDGKSMPDCGSIISLLEASTGKKPLIIGKPNVFMIDYVSEMIGVKKNKIAMVGDRLYTDMKMAFNANITSILVLSGETNKKMVEKSSKKPDYIFDSIANILQNID